MNQVKMFFVYSMGEHGTMYRMKDKTWSTEIADVELMSEIKASILAKDLEWKVENQRAGCGWMMAEQPSEDYITVDLSESHVDIIVEALTKSTNKEVANIIAALAREIPEHLL